jgi:hypothetical protein
MAEATLRFRNDGEAPLTISRIRCSCGCTAARLAKMVYQPGESGELVVRFDPTGRKGKQQKTCTIHSNDRENPTLTVRLKAEVMSLVWAEPTPLINMQQPRGLPFDETVTLWSRADEFELVRVESTSPLMRVDVGETERVWVEDEDRHHFRTPIRLSLPPDQPVGYVNGELRIISTLTQHDAEDEDSAAEQGAGAPASKPQPRQPDDDSPPTRAERDGEIEEGGQERTVDEERPRRRQNRRETAELAEGEHLVQVPFVVQIIGDINAEPRQLALGVLKPGGQFEGAFDLVSASGQPFEITEVVTEVRMEEATVEVAYEPLEGEQVGYRFRVVGTTPDRLGVLRGHLDIRTNVEAEAEKRVAFYGSVRPQR